MKYLPWNKQLIRIIVTSLAAVFLASGTEAAPVKEAAKTAKKTDEPPKITEYYKGAISTLGGVTMAGLQVEYTFIPEMGIRAVGLYIWGADFNSMNKDEYICSAILAPVLHLGPELKIADPVIMIGVVYSYHHWEMKGELPITNRPITMRKGTIHDVTFGGGFGINLKYAGRLKTGFNLWLNYDYSVESTQTLRKKKGNRIVLPVPLIEFTVQF